MKTSSWAASVMGGKLPAGTDSQKTEDRETSVARGPKGAPRVASISSPPSWAVSTHSPVAVTATVCSAWHAQLPSSVTAVQPSSSSCVSGAPRVSIGSTASAIPGTTTGPRERRPASGPRGRRWRTSGAMCMAVPIPWPT